MTPHDVKLTDARLQDIHLELIRRRAFNEFDGEQVYRDLLANRSLWDSALMESGFARLPGQELPVVPYLASLASDYWPVDMLYLLATDQQAAETLAQMANE